MVTTATLLPIHAAATWAGKSLASSVSRVERRFWNNFGYNVNEKAITGEDAEKNLPGSSGQWRDWLARLYVARGNDVHVPAAIANVADRLNGQISVLVAGIANQKDKSIESCAHAIYVGSSDSATPANLKSLDDVIRKSVDPDVTARGKKLAAFKAKHPLRAPRAAGLVGVRVSVRNQSSTARSMTNAD